MGLFHFMKLHKYCKQKSGWAQSPAEQDSNDPQIHFYKIIVQKHNLPTQQNT